MPSTRVGYDVAGHEQAVVAPYHRLLPGGARASRSMAAAISRANRSRLNRSACRRMTAGVERSLGGLTQTRRRAPRAGPRPRERRSRRARRFRAPRPPRARHDRPAAGLCLDATDPEVLLARQDDGGRTAVQLADFLVGAGPEEARRPRRPRPSAGRGRARRQRCAGVARRGGPPRWRRRCVCRGPARTQSRSMAPVTGRLDCRTPCPREDTPPRHRDHNIVGSGPQHTANSPHSGPRARRSPRPTAPAAA